MASSDVEICNMSLSRVGVSVFLETLDTSVDNTTEAVLCALWYGPMRDYVLRDADWSFARRYRALSLVEMDPNGEWRYAYRYPTDCFRARRIVQIGLRVNPKPPPFVVGGDDAGKLIYTDEPDAVLRYTTRITDPTVFDPKFDSALAWRIAVEIAPPLSRVKGMQQVAVDNYRMEIAAAEAEDANESSSDDPPDAQWIRDR